MATNLHTTRSRAQAEHGRAFAILALSSTGNHHATVSEIGGQNYFESLDEGARARLRDTAREMVRFAQTHATAVMIAPPPSKGGELNTASAVVLHVQSRYFLITAAHVLRHFEQRKANDPDVQWQVGDVVFDPRERVAFRDESSDVALLRLMIPEAPMIRVSVASPVAGWPPPHPTPGQFVLVSGYPALDRQRQGKREIVFNALSAMFQVTTSGPGYFVCQWQREFFASFDGPGVPPHGRSLGGISGGPVFAVGKLSYPLVGVISQFEHDFELLRIATLDILPPVDELAGGAA